jgi:hypothetical protein
MSPVQVCKVTPKALIVMVYEALATSESTVPLPVMVVFWPVVMALGLMPETWPGSPEPQSEMAKLIWSAAAVATRLAAMTLFIF